jgi:hypothetical protein
MNPAVTTRTVTTHQNGDKALSCTAIAIAMTKALNPKVKAQPCQLVGTLP